jgi:S-adenosylmethionine:tRNA ribosyltransferase-isomerase
MMPDLLVSDFDFDLPPESIALRPASPRDSARLLSVAGQDVGALGDFGFLDLPRLLRAGDVLVVNDTRVIPAQLFATKGEAAIGVTLHKREAADRWWSFVKNARRLLPGDVIDFGQGSVALSGTVLEKSGDGVLWQFDADGAALETALHAVGRMPLPPYIARRRGIDVADLVDYQTLHAAKDGAVAAPTAGLHFTPRLWDALAAAGIGRETVTLHVGAGTFLPVRDEDPSQHRIHQEWCEVSPEAAATINAARAAGRRIVCVGTTALRTLESAAAADGTVAPYRGLTGIYILPGYRFRAVDALLTNFHLPRSTLLMLVSAFAGTRRMRAAYAHAIAQGYRFFSYGDGSLLFRCDQDSLA